MVQITYIAFDGTNTTIEMEPGYSLMEGAIRNGIDGIEAACGGNSYCGTCRVYVDPEWREATGTMSETEQAIIESTDDDQAAVRLSCQIQIVAALDGLVVRLPEYQS